ncbi:hypothetical protein WJ0W_003539 [Paenibacillus melissococcoides]|uniref:Uncharacterized protein n=1 Tax=Paenibacillus melissococcoides TaxID=2912268 RepID=A0ABM9G3L3_9BACL|nr:MULTISPECIES: hypothetical protein [Paenibacillus]CAH8246304.1 hypothetical protein WJ0W_003539 [Paenibacillus melissococcoides]CAH8713568.1 hypothetical protein WDD9_003611 [Paenibacillus melissococcoides]CAH8714301.1 hypothetical protein HTL2_003914 [Paenibacillus melissococcoides]
MDGLSVKVKIEGLERLKKAIESLEAAVEEYEDAVAMVSVKKEATVIVVAPTFKGDVEDLKVTLQKKYQQSDLCKESCDCS